jgi:cytochrome P450
MGVAMSKQAPQPSSLEGFEDQIRYFDLAVRELGPIIQFPMGPQLTGMLVASATGADRVLRTGSEGYPKGPLWAAVGRITGNGLSTNQDLASWRRQRRLMNPAFSHTSVEHYVEQIHSVLSPLLDEWAIDAQESRPIDITTALTELTQIVILRTLFGSGIGHDERERVGTALVTALEEITRLQQIADPAAPISPEADQAIAFIDSIVGRLATDYRERLARGQEPERHLMGQLIAAADEDGSMSAHQLRDELMVSFLAGYETTALTLQWILFMLAQHPTVSARLDGEISRLGQRAPTYADVIDMPYLNAVLNEGMRLYPAVPYIPRQRSVEHADEIDGFEVPAGAIIFVGAWHIQRAEEHWGPDAHLFRPERWLQDADWHRAAFLPFSIGGRVCIGEHLSRVEMALGLIHLRQRFTWRLHDDSKDVLPVAMFTLRPSKHIMMDVTSAG